MDTELARTFLAVVSAGNFIGAAERLHLTQSAVSARMQNLEAQLGRRLFVRNKAGATLTAAGRQFQRHAMTLVRTVELARQQIGVSPGFENSFTVGARLGLWEGYLLEWLPRMLAASPGTVVRAEIGFEPDLMQGLIDGRLDVAVMYTPESRPGLRLVPLLEERLLLVTTDGRGMGPGYVHVDWGPEFLSQHRAAFPDIDGPQLTVNIGWLGLQYIRTNGGGGYFPERLVAEHLRSGALSVVADAPVFRLPAYAVCNDDSPAELIDLALATLKEPGSVSHGNAQSPA